MNRTTARLASLLAVSLLIGACAYAPGASPTPSPTPSPSPSPTPTPPAGLDGRQFLSTGVTVDGAAFQLVPGTRIRLSFVNGGLSAQAGCNTIGGNHVLEGNVFVFTGGGMTEMGCDPARHAQDDWLSTFLASRPTITLAGNDLILAGATATVTLLDREIAEPDFPLTNVTWTLTSIINGEAVSSVPANVMATITFRDDGSVELNAGCNRGGGRYELVGDQIRFTDIVLTKIGCGPPAGQVEGAVLQVLSAEGLSLTIDADSLTLQVGDIGLGFRPIEG